MTFLEKLASQVNRILGTEVISSDMTEAESLNALEDIPSVANINQIESTLKNIQTKLGEFEKVDFNSFASNESVANLKVEMDNKFDTVNSSVESFNSSLSAKIAKELNDFKGSFSQTTSTAPEQVHGVLPISEDGSKEMKVNMSNLFKGTTVPGLNI